MGYNSNSTQNQNVFQPTARDLLGRYTAVLAENDTFLTENIT